MSLGSKVPPVFQRAFHKLPQPVFYFQDVTTGLPIVARVKWVSHNGYLPTVLNNSFSSIVSAAVFVADQRARTKGSTAQFDLAFRIIQEESGLAPYEFSFAQYDWLEHYTFIDKLEDVVSALPPSVAETLRTAATLETCTRVHWREYDRFMRGQLSHTISSIAKLDLDKGSLHYRFMYVPCVLPNGVIPPDVVSSNTLVQFLKDKARLGPLQIVDGENDLLWINRPNGMFNPNASTATNTNLTGEAWVFSSLPVFPTSEHGATHKGAAPKVRDED